MRALGDHLGNVLPAASAFCSAKTGQPKVCRCFMLAPTRIELNFSSLDVPSSCTGRVLNRSAALRKAYGHRARCTAAGQRARACSNCLRALSERSRIARSAIPFWKWALTPQKVSLCRALSHEFLNALSAKRLVGKSGGIPPEFRGIPNSGPFF